MVPPRGRRCLAGTQRPRSHAENAHSAGSASSAFENQNTNFTPSCTSRIGFLVLLIVPYSGLVNVVFGSFQIGLLNRLNASSRNCTVFEAIRKLRMIDPSTLVIPGPKNVLRPALPNVPGAFSAYASVLNHRAMVSWPPGKTGSCPVTFGRSCPPPVFDRSVPT